MRSLPVRLMQFFLSVAKNNSQSREMFYPKVLVYENMHAGIYIPSCNLRTSIYDKSMNNNVNDMNFYLIWLCLNNFLFIKSLNTPDQYFCFYI